jgi:hypothetical protein
MDAETEVPIPEVPTIVDAEILKHPASGSDCLLATTEDGDRVAFGFEIESESPGLVFVEPSLWLETPAPEQSDVAFQAERGLADDWLQAVVAHPVGFDWLTVIKHAHPAEYDRWFSQAEYDDGGEGGS